MKLLSAWLFGWLFLLTTMAVFPRVSSVRRYFGCRDDILTGTPTVSGTLATCYADCAENNYKFAGLTQPISPSVVTCYCADPLPTPNLDDSLCDAQCMNEPTFSCGDSAGSVASVYVDASPLATAALRDCHNLTYVNELAACRTSLAAQANAVMDVTLDIGQTFYYLLIVYTPNQCSETPSGCWINPNSSLANATCSFNTANGHRTCACPTGYEDAVPANTTLSYIPGTNCTDSDECATNPCTANHSSCQNTMGSFMCVCNPGTVDVSGNGSVCELTVSECLLPIPPICDVNADCITLDSGNPRHSCSCKPGYTGTGEVCNNTNECEDSPTPCGDNATCTDTIGSFECTCVDGTIMLPNGSCVAPPIIIPCRNVDPMNYDRQVVWGSSCSVAVLINCSDYSNTYQGERVIVENRTNANCVNNQLVTTLDSSFLMDNRADFTSSGGKALLNAQVECTSESFSIKFDRTVANLAGFNLGNLFLGGYGAFSSVQTAYGNEPECKGQPWYQDGIQYKFGLPGDSTACGTQHIQTETEITYTNVVRGQIDEGGNAEISRLVEFFLGYSCVYNRQSNVASNSFFVYSRRRKRDVEVSASIILPDKEVSMEMALYKDRGISEPYSSTEQLNVGDLIYADVSLPTNHGGRFEIQILRCWQTTTNDGRGSVFKNIISNGCESNQWTENGNVLLPSSDASSVRFGFPVKSIEGNNENIYVSCMLDVLDKLKYSDFKQRCTELTPNPSTFRADAYMKVVTVGPVSVRDVCGGMNNGGCQQSCSVTSQQTPRCFCLSGFEVDPTDSSRCRLSNPVSPSTSPIVWYYYVIPILVLFLLIALVGLAIYKVKKSRRSHAGKYVLTEPDATSTSGEQRDFLH